MCVHFAAKRHVQPLCSGARDARAPFDSPDLACIEAHVGVNGGAGGVHGHDARAEMDQFDFARRSAVREFGID